MLGDFNVAETCSDFCNLRFRISKRSKFKQSNKLGLVRSNKIKIKTKPARFDGMFCLFHVYKGLGYGEEVEVIIL
jgi:hypothetical protein